MALALEFMLVSMGAEGMLILLVLLLLIGEIDTVSEPGKLARRESMGMFRRPAQEQCVCPSLRGIGAVHISSVITKKVVIIGYDLKDPA